MRLAVNKSNSSMWLSTSSMNLATSSLFVYLDPSLQKTRQQKNKADPSLHPLVKRVSYYTNGRMWLWRCSPDAKIWLTWSQTPATCLLQSCSNMVSTDTCNTARLMRQTLCDQSLKKVQRLDWRMTCFTCIKAIVTNSVSVLPYAHPQLFKVFKHLIYVWHGCGMQFERF